ncbi:redoxin domain-containing protein [Halorussus salilacus]|uniref:redoxin domain-containing protein n=1 Tax=Halorussus salilacus TaxID=2953750 RepID=UPI00209EEA6F|nr:redoxin domain-containing protein [Halorussus salilacus]USZ69266.1 redoxin domain-containing protein [Halorussus salilacus]
MSDSRGLAVGERVPDVTETLVRPDGDRAEATLSELYDEKPVLLSFYTNDFSPDCIEEWCSFRDYDWFASGDDVRVVGVSKSRPYTHRKFIDYLDLNFPLYADTDLAISDAFGVTYRVFKVAARSRRSCFLVDTDGVVRYKWVGEHPLDPTRDTPPVADVHEAIVEEFGDDPETFGF